MMMPSIFGENLFDDFDSWFDAPVFQQVHPMYPLHFRDDIQHLQRQAALLYAAPLSNSCLAPYSSPFQKRGHFKWPLFHFLIVKCIITSRKV